MTLPHVHHWKIVFKQGEESPAVCEGCGQTKMFANSHHDGRPWVHRCGHPYNSSAHRDGCLSAKD